MKILSPIIALIAWLSLSPSIWAQLVLLGVEHRDFQRPPLRVSDFAHNVQRPVHGHVRTGGAAGADQQRNARRGPRLEFKVALHGAVQEKTLTPV